MARRRHSADLTGTGWSGSWSSWIGDVYGRQREAATLVDVARQQASRGEFATAWTSLERANGVRPGDAVDAARIDIAFAWLEDARPGPGQRFAVITDRGHARTRSRARERTG